MTKPRKTKAQKAGKRPALNLQHGPQDGTPSSKSAKTRRSGGNRPSTFAPEIGAKICAAIANGETLTSLCSQKGYPDRTTVWRWMQQFPDFEDQYLKARVFSQQMRGDEAIDIARTEEDIARARVMIDARRIVVTRLSSQYAGLIQARTPEAQPFDLAGALEDARKRIDKLIDEVGHERAQRIIDDQHVEDARNPKPGTPECIVRANQRVAINILEERKKALLAETDGKVH